jgi:hypothetical protein
VAETAPCGYCGHPVPAGARECARCGIRLIDVTRHHWGYQARERVLDTLDRAADGARDRLADFGPRKAVALATVAGLAIGAAAIGARRRRARKA